jgi:Rhodopirellula transposase DDE domain
LRQLAESHAQQDPTFQTSIADTRLTAQSALKQLQAQGFTSEQLPAASPMALILNRMGYRLRSVVKAKPQKIMTDTELVQTLVQYVIQQLGEVESSDDSAHRKAALAAFDSNDDRTIKILALLHPKDRFLDSLSYLSGARRLATSNPIVALTTLKEAINALVDVRRDKDTIWDEVKAIVLVNTDLPS